MGDPRPPGVACIDLPAGGFMRLDAIVTVHEPTDRHYRGAPAWVVRATTTRGYSVTIAAFAFTPAGHDAAQAWADEVRWILEHPDGENT